MHLNTTLAAAAVLAASAPMLAHAESIPFEATTLALSASGDAHVAPDIATINLGVQTEAPSAAEALRQNAAKMTATIAALKARGVLSKDIQTSELSLSPQYVFHDNDPRRLTGYQVSNTVTIIVRDITRLGGAVDAVVGAGANQIDGVAFGLSDPQHAEDDARRAAVKALQAKAALYAEAAGLRVARLVSLTDTGGSSPVRPMAMMASFKRVAAAPTPTEPGDLDVTASVSAVFELKK